MKNKKVLIAIIVAVLLIGIVGVTFAAYTYTRNGTSNSKQVVGDIYMHYTESNTLTLSNAMPSSTYISNNYFEFTVDGKNTTTNKDIIYDIVLSHGDVPQGKTETNRIDDKFLKFRLVEVISNNETEILNNKSYDDLTSKRIHVETIPKNTTSQVTHTYRLYMWIGDEVVIGNINQDYTESEWSNLFASIKVNVSGDFTEKEVGNKVRKVVYNQMNNGGSSYIKSYNATKGDASFDSQDTVGTNPNKLDVLYYTGTDALTHGNVLFAGYCWQIIRTTDTGGLRIIYNGPAENNKCLTSRNSGGTLKGINAKESTAVSGSTNISSITNFGVGYDYNLSAGTFTLVGTSELAGKTWENNASELIGTYACADNTTTCTELWYIGHYQSTTTASVGKYVIGTTAHYSQIGTSYYNAYNDSPALVGYMYNKAYTYKSGVKTGDYANSVTWNGTSYVLDSSTTTNLTAPNETHHYVCDTDCTKVRFYYFFIDGTYYYLLLENGDTNPVYAMLNGKTQNETVDANINRYSSAIKGQIDNWYKKNIDSLNSSVKGLIDTSSVHCNDRSSNNNFGSWNKDAANLTTILYFYQYSANKDLRCANVTDRFSVGNEKANLSYPVGLITEPERNLMSANYAATGQYYWGVSPFFSNHVNAGVRRVSSSGDTYYSSVRSSYGARPVVTLSADADISEGDGSYDTPYVIGDKIVRNLSNYEY